MDREDDHGKEVKGEEEIYQEEGRSGAQEEENNEVGGEEGSEENHKEGAEEGHEEGGSQAQGAGEETGTGDARGGTCARSVLATAPGFLLQRRRRKR